jgi:hypothetical protein
VVCPCGLVKIPVSDAIVALTLISFVRRQAQFKSILVSKLVAHYQSIFPSDGSGLHGDAVHHSVGNPLDYPKRNWRSCHSMGQLGRHPFWFRPRRTIPGSHLAKGPPLVVGLTLTKWSSVFCAFIFFIFFGFAAEARRHLLQCTHQASHCMPFQETRFPCHRKVWVSERLVAITCPFFDNYWTDSIGSSSRCTRLRAAPLALLLVPQHRIPRRQRTYLEALT